MPKTSAERAPPQAANVPAHIADQIRLMIIRGTLTPGFHLRQSELAEMFGSSLVPVREALKLLAAEGVVNHDQNRGFFIAQLSSDEARQLYHLRNLLETSILSTLAWPTEAELRALQTQLSHIEALRDEGRIMEWSAAHREFHRGIYNLSTETFLVKEAVRLWSIADRYRSLLVAAPERRPTDGGSHDRHLLAALKAMDRTRLLAVAQADHEQMAEALVAALKARGL